MFWINMNWIKKRFLIKIKLKKWYFSNKLQESSVKSLTNNTNWIDFTKNNTWSFFFEDSCSIYFGFKNKQHKSYFQIGFIKILNELPEEKDVDSGEVDENLYNMY